MNTRSCAASPVLIALLLLVPIAARGQETAAAAARELIASGRHPWARWADVSRSADAVSRLYPAGGAAPLWADGGAVKAPGRAAIAQLAAAEDQGLDPRDYDAALLDSLARRLAVLSPGDRARFDLLLTVDLLRFLEHVRHGRLRSHPLDRTPSSGNPDLVAAVAAASRGKPMTEVVRAVEPPLAQYRMLRAGLARYRRLVTDTSLGGLSAGQFVWPGARYDSLARLAHILVAGGDLAPDSTPSGAAYQGAVVAAVRRFQQRHALSPDGVLGPNTLAALDAPASEWVRRIEMALERLRWVPPVAPGRFLVVNIPAFQLVGFDSAAAPRPAVSMPVVVGHAVDRRTPVLFEELRYVEFLPYWTVPRSIVVGEVLPLIDANPGFLRATDMEVVTPKGRVLGDSVTPAMLDGLRRGRLTVRQRPGPLNSLGLAKFIFPNAQNVYLHGTPRTERFAERQRDLSHGCISVQDPEALATWILSEQPGWTRPLVQAAMSGNSTRRVMLRRAMPVLIFYTTAVARADGSVWFYPDVYGHDRELADALRSAPRR